MAVEPTTIKRFQNRISEFINPAKIMKEPKLHTSMVTR